MAITLTLLYIFYLITNHSFNKIGILMNVELDKQLHLPENSSWFAVITSTFLAAIGKTIGSFVEITSIRYAICSLFLLNGICMFITLNTNNILIFNFFRNFQGLISGFQTSIVIGFIGIMKDNQAGFANYTGVSAIVSLVTSLVLQRYGVFNMSYLLLLLNIIPAIFFFISLKDFNQIYKTVPIVAENIYDAMKDWRFWFYALIIGMLLAWGLYAIRLQNELISVQGSDLIKSYRFVIGGLVFVIASFISFIRCLQNIHCSLLFIIFGLISYHFGVKFQSLYMLLASSASIFLSFSSINPVLCHKVTEISNDKFVNSSIFFSMRSGFTSIFLWLANMNIFNSINIFSKIFYLLLSSLVLLSLYCIISLYEKNKNPGY